MKRKWKICALLLLLMVGLCACSSEKKEGECECVVELKDIPAEFKMLPENILENIRIRVSVENIVTEKSETVYLTQENEFSETLYFHPGTYRVTGVYVSPSYLAELEVEASEEKFELDRNDDGEVEVFVSNAEAFADWVWSMEATREIVQADAFSRMVQYEGQVIDLKQIAQYVEFSYDSQVPSYDKVTLKNMDKGVYITIQNQTEEPADWTSCEVLEVTFRSNNVIFGQDIRLGMDVTTLVHKEDGILGTPDKMSGTALIGAGYASTKASYIDGASGDILTLEIDSSGDYIRGLTYAFELFE